MKINKISSKFIKPQTPTPQNLKNYQISFVDQFMPPINIAVVLFYQSKPQDYIVRLEESLAKTLLQFYTLAGRFIKNDHIVDCSDEGAEFIEAEALDIELLDLVAKMEPDQLNAFLPDQYFRCDEAAADPLLSIQVTHLPSGGAAIAVSVSHRVFDVSSLGTFVAAWSNAANPVKTVELSTPTFHIPSLLPYWDLDLVLGSNEFSMEAEKVDVKRLVFNKEALTKIRANIDGETVSGVRVVCAVIARALIRVDRAKHEKSKDLLMFQLINMRERTVPPQPKHACGNFAIPSHVRRVPASEAGEIGIRQLVDLIGDSLRNSISEYAEILSPDRDGRGIIMNTLGNVTKEIWMPETNAVTFSDWSKFGFYGADFGWGKPVWTSIGPTRPPISTVVLMSDKEGDGIEAWLHFNQNDMHYFEQDEEIKSLTA